MPEQLLPCPFCGAAPELHVGYRLCLAHCPVCGATQGLHETRDEATRAWNRRPAQAWTRPPPGGGPPWRPIGPDTPRGVKLQLRDHSGRTASGVYDGRDDFWAEWAPFPG